VIVITHILVSKEGISKKVEFDNEKELENIVIKNYRLLFGDYSILIPQEMVSTSSGHRTIPDIIVLNFKDKA